MRTLIAFFWLVPAALGGQQYYSMKTVDHTKVSAVHHTDLTNFTVYAHLSDARFKSASNDGHVAGLNGYDLIPYPDITCTTPLHFRRITYDASAGTADFWVLVSGLSHSVNTPIYFCYGDSSISSDQQDPANAWEAAYAGVWHLAGAGSVDATDDLGNTATATGTVSAVAGGPLGYGYSSFAGSGGISLANAAIPASPTGTIEMWMQVADAGQYGLITRTNGANPWPYWSAVFNNQLFLFVGDGTGHVSVSSNSRINNNTWTHVVFAWDTSPAMSIYVNGVLDATNALGHSIDTAPCTVWMGNDGQNEQLKGALSEVRMSTAVRSADWIGTEYNNQSAESSFFLALSREGQPVSNPCTVSAITPTAPLAAAFLASSSSGNTATITVAPAGCSWSLAQLPDWIAVTSGASGTGDGMLTYNIAANSGAARSGQISTAITGATDLTVQQAAADAVGFAPRFLGSPQSGWMYTTPKTALAGYNYIANFGPRYSLPITANVSTQTVTLPSSYTITGSEVNVGVQVGPAGTLPGGLKGTFKSSTSSGISKLTLTGGSSFTPAMVGNQIAVGIGSPANTEFHTVQSYLDAHHITVDALSSDQTRAAYWYGGLYAEWAYNWATYSICNVSGSTVTLKQSGGCTQPLQPFTDPGSGQLYMLFSPGSATYSSNMIYITGLIGLPAGSTVNWYWPGNFMAPITGTPWMNGQPDQYNVGSVELIVSIPAGAARGTYHPVITACQNPDGSGACSSLQWVLVVGDVPFHDYSQRPTTFPPVPGLSTWQSFLTTSNLGAGGYWCKKGSTLAATSINYNDPGCADPRTGTGYLSPTCSTNVWYYEGVANYAQIAAYLQDSTWNYCAVKLAIAFAEATSAADHDKAPLTGSIQGQNVQPDNLFWGYRVTHDQRQLTALMDYRSQNNYSFLSIGAGEPGRELALQLKAQLLQEESGFPRSPYLMHTAEVLINQIFCLTDGINQPQGTQPFYLGIAADALIEYWHLTKDPRVPYAIKRAADYILANYDSRTAHAATYNTAPSGPRCGAGIGVSVPNSPGTLWFETPQDGHCGEEGPIAANQLLNNVFSHMFAWLFASGYGSQYQTAGDDMFQHTWDGFRVGNAIYSGKTWSQTLYDTWQYIGWRSGTLAP